MMIELLFVLCMQSGGWWANGQCVWPTTQMLSVEEQYYSSIDPYGYSQLIDVIRQYHVSIVRPNKESQWYRQLPDFDRESAMFVLDTPIVYLNDWDTSVIDPGMTIATVWHELVHVLGQSHSEYFGQPIPPIDLTANWRTWMLEELFATNVQLNVAKRLETTAGVQYARWLGQLFWSSMDSQQQLSFIQLYGAWIEPDLLPQPR